jgi:hypothetical protein
MEMFPCEAQQTGHNAERDEPALLQDVACDADSHTHHQHNGWGNPDLRGYIYFKW